MSEHDRMIIRALRWAIASAVFIMVAMVANIVVGQLGRPSKDEHAALKLRLRECELRTPAEAP